MVSLKSSAGGTGNSGCMDGRSLGGLKAVVTFKCRVAPDLVAGHFWRFSWTSLAVFGCFLLIRSHQFA